MRQLINTNGLSGFTAPVRFPDEIRVVFASGETFVTDIRRNRGAPGNLFGVRVPVKVGEAIKFVLTAMPQNTDMLRVLSETYRRPGWFAIVLDGSGKIVARSHGNDEFAGRSASEALLRRIAPSPRGLIETVDLEGRTSITAYETVRGSWWRRRRVGSQGRY